MPSDNTGVVVAAAGLVDLWLASGRRLGLRAPLLSNGTGVTAATAIRLDRWAIRSFGLCRRGFSPGKTTGVSIATTGRYGLRFVPARPLGR
ncbi:hypothetical protein GCM10025880_29430 [Methylorubrum aminovorans]|uniref:hypothetical protein n=1 Tax=Methylorubrum aminovorans TaxID=269069 RepID=UPI0023E94566|nr:hypothetical protein [Methylorubrum aminovorans]GMA76526.1 hypothetical protein GCM10025880_29430 [Methylorubrum aminovorans]